MIFCRIYPIQHHGHDLAMILENKKVASASEG